MSFNFVLIKIKNSHQVTVTFEFDDVTQLSQTPVSQHGGKTETNCSGPTETSGNTSVSPTQSGRPGHQQEEKHWDPRALSSASGLQHHPTHTGSASTVHCKHDPEGRPSGLRLYLFSAPQS